jgi:cell division septation protein DedD
MTTEAVAGFQTPEEAALDLELPLLGTLPSPSDASGPIAPRVPPDERARREYHRAADRILLSPLSRAGSIGLIGDVASLRRARIAADLAAALSSEKTSILVDADLAGAHLSFDERGRAQEGLVDVLRYGVRSPRVVAPTQAPGLNLLPVGSGTVDLASTYGSDATTALFEELRRTGDLVIVNGPDLTDLEVAGPFVAEVGAWILVHEFGASDPRRTRGLKEALGHAACLGVLAVVLDRAKTEAMSPPLPPRESERALPEPVAEEPAADLWESPAPATEETSVGGPFEPIRAVPPERDEGAAWRARELPDLRGTDPGLLEEKPRGGGGRRLGASKILAGVLIAAVAGVGGFLWLGGGDEKPEAPAGHALRKSPSSPPVATAPEVPATEAPAAEAPPVEKPPVEKPAVEKAAVEKPAVEKPAPATPRPAPAAAPRAAGPPAVVPGGAWGVHVSSILTEAGAKQELETLQRAGWPAVSRHVLVPDKGWWFRVYAGPYATKEDAKQAAAEIKKTRVSDWAVALRIPDEGTGREDR